jgi:DnaJ homolog subfamily C member 19
MRFIIYAALAAALYFLWRKFKASSATLSVNDAAKLLGVPTDATPDEIAAAHKRLIAKVHPDAGGSANLAAQVNQARDILIREANKR